jgi:hypothetical protein
MPNTIAVGQSECFVSIAIFRFVARDHATFPRTAKAAVWLEQKGPFDHPN